MNNDDELTVADITNRAVKATATNKNWINVWSGDGEYRNYWGKIKKWPTVEGSLIAVSLCYYIR